MKDFIKKFSKKEETQTDKINKERSEIKETMAKNLKNIGFSDEEVQEVTSILARCEEDVQEFKDLLIGSNINNDDTIGTMQVVFEQIRKVELQAAEDIKAKIAEIRKRHEGS